MRIIVNHDAEHRLQRNGGEAGFMIPVSQKSLYCRRIDCFAAALSDNIRMRRKERRHIGNIHETFDRPPDCGVFQQQRLVLLGETAPDGALNR